MIGALKNQAKAWIAAGRRRQRAAALRRSQPIATQADIVAGLKRLGVAPGDTLFVHSSLKSLGYVEGGPPSLIAALQEAVGPAGTLLLPTYYLPGGTILATCQMRDYVFDPRTHGTNLGALPSAFLATPGIRRSIHPTHSVSAWGAKAEAVTADHHRAPSIFGPGSPWERLVALDGKVLGLGVSTGPITLPHLLEDQMGDAFPEAIWMDERYHLPAIDHDGSRVLVPVRAFRPEAVARRIDHKSRDDLRAYFRARLEATGQMRAALVGAAESWLIPARAFVETLELMAADGITVYSSPEALAAHIAARRES